MTIMSQNSSLANRYVVVVIGVIITAVIVSSYLLFVSDTPSITKATVQVFTWILHPELHGELFSAANYAVLVGLLSFDFLLGLSVILAILPKEFQDNHLMVIPSSMLLGLALIGVFSILSVQFNNLTRESILSLAAAAIVVSNYISNRQKGQHVMTFLQEFFSSNFRKPAAFKVNSFSVKLLFVPIIIVIYAMIFFQATSFPITEWDAIVYHANVAKIWYENAPNYKVIAGPSVGIQMSYQYPPLFPAIGAAHYIIAGEFNDLYLRIEAPFLSLLTALMIYWIARKYL